MQMPDGSAFRFFPYQRQPAFDLFDERLDTVVYRWYSGAGKTFVKGGGILYGAHQLGLHMAVMYPNELDSKEYLRDKWMPLHDATPCMDALGFVKDLALFKSWPNGARLAGIGANSSSRIRRLEVDYMDADEIDAIDQTATDEGDKLAQFYTRGRGRRRQFKSASSYPSLYGESKIDGLYEQSDQCRWMFTHQACQEVFEARVEWIQYEVENDVPVDAHFLCPKCKRRIDDAERVEMSPGWILAGCQGATD